MGPVDPSSGRRRSPRRSFSTHSPVNPVASRGPQQHSRARHPTTASDGRPMLLVWWARRMAAHSGCIGGLSSLMSSSPALSGTDEAGPLAVSCWGSLHVQDAASRALPLLIAICADSDVDSAKVIYVATGLRSPVRRVLLESLWNVRMAWSYSSQPIVSGSHPVTDGAIGDWTH